jgi:alcohol dehydrogenase class IV
MKKLYIPQKYTKKYLQPTQTYFGRGSFEDTLEIIKTNKLKKVLLVCGAHFKDTSWFNSILPKLKFLTSIEVYPEELTKSDFSTINKLTEYCRNNQFDSIIGIGGGTILDIAKSAKILISNKGRVEDYVVSGILKINKKGVFYIAIPTTAGTGSELTPWATIWGDDKKKYSLSS